MSGKIVTFNPEAREKLVKGVNIVADAVGVTLGPKGRNVVIDTYGTPAVTKDGVTVAKYISLVDPIENLGAQLIKQAANKCGINSGDGTSGSTVIARALVTEAMSLINQGVSPIDIKRGFEELLQVTLTGITKTSKPVDEARIKQIATISANNDAFTGDLIASAFQEVGRDGILTVEDSRTNETYTKVVDGVSINRGFLSPYFMTDRERLEAVYEDAYVFITDKKLRTDKDIIPVLESVVMGQKKPLLIIADDIEAHSLALLVVNRMRLNIPVVAIKAPAYGDRRRALLEDLAVITGGELISEASGTRIEDTTVKQLGRVQKVIVTQDETILIGPSGDKKIIEQRATEVRSALSKATHEYEKEKLAERLAKLIAKVAVLYVGAATETEVKEKKDRIDDAIRATRAAIVKGFVPGGGTTLLELSTRLESNTSPDILSAYLSGIRSPIRQIVSNAGADPDEVLTQLSKSLSSSPSAGYNAATGEFVKDMSKVGIIDPTLVVEEALINAVSAANMVILSEVTIHDTQEKYTPPSLDEMGPNPYDM